MAAFYADEEEIWKCAKHPMKKRRTGICPTCLRERLMTLCPESSDSTSSCSSSSSSSYTLFQYTGSQRGEIGRVSNLIAAEPAFTKSRSLAIPFLRSRSKPVELPRVSRSSKGFWSVFRTKKGDLNLNDDELSNVTEDYSRMVRSRSVAVGGGGGERFGHVTTKRRGWYFPSPMKAFARSKTSKVELYERSPMQRG